MTILADQIVLMESEVMADTEDGGGRMSGNEVADGQVNNTFPDISRLDRVYGRTQLRKLFLAVMTANQDTLLGAHTILTRTPADPRVKVTLFKTDSHIDRREDAKDRIESYVVKSVEAPFFLVGTQLAGQRAISCAQRFEQPIPAIGSVFCLVNSNDTEQYVRITDIEVGRSTFTYQNGSEYVDFQRRTLTLSLANPLEMTFNGTSPVTPMGRAQTAAKIMTTQVADASRYYSTAQLTEAAQVGDLTLNVDSIFAPLVPSAQTEILIVDEQAATSAAPLAAASTTSLSVTASNPSIDADGFAVYYAGGGVLPGSLQLVTSLYGTYSDDGGKLKHVSGNNYLVDGEIDYSTGRILFKSSSAALYSATMTMTFRPAAAPSVNAETWATPVTIGTRGFNYVFQTPQPPSRGTVVVEYMSLGNWYRISDLGNGTMTGDGVGTVDYNTGTITVTLLALPDVDSQIVWSWSEDISYRIQSGITVPAYDTFRYETGQPIAPGTVSLTWSVSGTNYSMTDNGNGLLTGDGTGRVNYGAGIISYRPDTNFVDIELEYNAATSPVEHATFTPNLSGGNISFTIPNAPLKPGSIAITVPVQRGESVPYGKLFCDTADGNIRELKGDVVGTINHTTGLVTMNPRGAYTQSVQVSYVWVPTTGSGSSSTSGTWERDDFPAPGDEVSYRWEEVAATETYNNGSTVNVTYRPAAASDTPTTVLLAARPLIIDLVPDVLERALPGSVIFTYRGNTYRDRDGAIITSYNHTTDAGTAVGTIDYASGRVSLTSYPTTGSGTVSIRACLTERGRLPVRRIVFRTAGAPLRPGSLIISGRTRTGVDFQVFSNPANSTVSASTAGIVSGGTVDAQTGIVSIKFSVPVMPDSLTYSAVSYRYLPLDAGLIGLDPVRLPADGRVPVFRPGDVVVVSHTIETTVPSPTAGGVVTFTRDYQAEAWVIGANGRRLRADQYVLDRVAGTLTWADPLNLVDGNGDAVTTPLTVFDRVEDMALATDVQITGQISINTALTQDYPAGSLVCSSVLHGDLRSRVYNLFHQQAWSTVWSDERQGNDTTAKYNNTTYPIEITNQGSIEERWAIRFTSSNTFECIGESVGVIGSGNTSSNFAPTNPATGVPYFRIFAAGFGTGWVAGNTLRFNTEGAQAPFWVARTVLSGPAAEANDQFITQNRGDAD